MSEETKPAKAEKSKAKARAEKEPSPMAEEKPAAKAKVEKVKEPALEELPFEEFVNKHYVPALAKAFSAVGITDLELQLNDSQLQGRWQNKLRQFNLYFPKRDINAQKAFSCADGGFSPSDLEPFLIDERKATLDLMVFGVMQRLNAQKWLKAN